MLLANSKRQPNVEGTLDFASKIWVKIHGVLITRCVLWEGLLSFSLMLRLAGGAA